MPFESAAPFPARLYNAPPEVSACLLRGPYSFATSLCNKQFARHDHFPLMKRRFPCAGRDNTPTPVHPLRGRSTARWHDRAVRTPSPSSALRSRIATIRCPAPRTPVCRGPPYLPSDADNDATLYGPLPESNWQCPFCASIPSRRQTRGS